MTTASKVLLAVFGSVALAIAGVAVYSGAYGLLVLSVAVLAGARALIAGDVPPVRGFSAAADVTDSECAGTSGAPYSLTDTRNPVGYTNPVSPLYPRINR